MSHGLQLPLRYGWNECSNHPEAGTDNNNCCKRCGKPSQMVFIDPHGQSADFEDVLDAVNASQDVLNALAQCVSVLVSAGHSGASFVENAIRLLDGGSGEVGGRKWQCAEGKVTWQN